MKCCGACSFITCGGLLVVLWLLAQLFPEDRFLLVSDRGFRLRLCAPPNLKPGRPPRNWLERRWWLWGLAGG